MDRLSLAQACVDSMLVNDAATRELGMTVQMPEPGVAVVRMRVREDMVNGFRTCHGGFVFALADSAFAFACNSYNDVTVAASASIDYLKPALAGDELVATAREIRRGRRAGVYDVEVRNQDDELVAVFRGRSAALGRPALEE